jgi:hypothetical protein
VAAADVAATHLVDAALQKACPQPVALHVWVDEQVMDGGHLQQAAGACQPHLDQLEQWLLLDIQRAQCA